jgi:uncharacterized RDD family membrane protein YckC
MDAQYKIIGGDGAEYGPVPLDELQGWIIDGRVSGATQVWRSDMSLWSPADRYQELQQDLSRLYASSAAIMRASGRPAGFWARLGAYLLDQLVLIPLFVMVWFPVADALQWQRLPPEKPAEINNATLAKFGADWTVWADRAALVYLPLFMLYDVLLNGTFGATFGKMAIGAQIRLLDGSRLTYSRAMLRWWAARLSQFILFGGFLLIAVRADKRGLHDLLAGTKVIYQR